MIHPSEEGARVTTFELFFDLVFVFAFTQVTRLMAVTHTGLGIAQAFVHPRPALVDLGLIRLARQPDARRPRHHPGRVHRRDDLRVHHRPVDPGGVSRSSAAGSYAPAVLVTCYLIARIIHGVLYYLAAGEDTALKRQVLTTVPATLVTGGALLIIGVVVGEPWQTWFWLAALVVDAGIVYFTSRIGWRVHSAAHWTERHGLIIILALGESVVSVGAGVARLPLSVEILIGSALAVLLAFGLWWAYFELLSPASEKILARREGLTRAVIARDAYTYLHFPMVAGIIIAALGLELAMEHVADPGPLGEFGGFSLGIGIAVYLLATFFFWRRVSGKWAWPRLASGLLFLVVSPLFAIVPALAALAVAVAAIGLVVIVEWLAYREMQVPE